MLVDVRLRPSGPLSEPLTMHDAMIAVLFVFMLFGPCLVTLGGSKR